MTMVKNQETRSHVEWILGLGVPTLPFFSLVFTKDWSGDYPYHTIWHKEEIG